MKRAALWAAFLILVVVGLVKCFPGPSPAATSFTPPVPKQVEAGYTIKVYTAKWCGRCQQDKPYLHQLESAGWAIHEIDIDAAGIRMSVPWYRVYKDGSPLFQTQNIYEIQ